MLLFPAISKEIYRVIHIICEGPQIYNMPTGIPVYIYKIKQVFEGLVTYSKVKRINRGYYVKVLVILCVCVFFPSILDIKFVGRTSRGHTGGRSHRIFNPPSFCGACLDFCIKLTLRDQDYSSSNMIIEDHYYGYYDKIYLQFIVDIWEVSNVQRRAMGTDIH